MSTPQQRGNIVLRPQLQLPRLDQLQLWLDAGAVYGVANGGGVSTWADQSGKGRNATQANATYQPTLQNNVLNGWPVLRWDGSNDYMTISSIVVAQPLTAIVVGKSAGNASSSDYFLDDATGTSRVVISRKLNGSDANQFGLYAGAVLSVSDSGFNNSFQIFTGVYNGTSSEFWSNTGKRATGNAGSTNMASLTIGAYAGGSSHTLNGDIAEIVVLSGALDVNEMAIWRRYYADKYNLSIS